MLGVLIRRLPAHRPVVFARSQCDSCARALTGLDLIPLASFAALGGRCRHCDAPIGWFHPAVELAALAIAVWTVSVVAGGPARIWADCGFGWALLALAWIDAEHLILPDVLTLPLIVAGLGVTWTLAPATILAHTLGVIIGYAGFRAIALGYRALRGQDGLGEGDAKLLAAAGAWVGIAALPRLVFTAALLGLIVALIAALAARYRHGEIGRAIPFGPPLALAAFLTRLHH